MKAFYKAFSLVNDRINTVFLVPHIITNNGIPVIDGWFHGISAYSAGSKAAGKPFSPQLFRNCYITINNFGTWHKLTVSTGENLIIYRDFFFRRELSETRGRHFFGRKEFLDLIKVLYSDSKYRKKLQSVVYTGNYILVNTILHPLNRHSSLLTEPYKGFSLFRKTSFYLIPEIFCCHFFSPFL